MTPGRREHVSAAASAAVWCCYAASAINAQDFDAVLVRFDEQFRPTVSRVAASEVRLKPKETGLIVWSDEGGDCHRVFTGTWVRPRAAQRQSQYWQVNAGNQVRGAGVISGGGVLEVTNQLDPLLLPAVTKSLTQQRGAGLLTPPSDSLVLGAWPTLRRAAANEAALPAVKGTLTSGGQSAGIEFPAGVAALPFSSLTNLPAAWKSGLPAGQYLVHLDGMPSQVRSEFTVVTDAVRARVMGWLEQWRALEDVDTAGLNTLLSVEYLLAQQPQPFVTDALDLLDQAPPGQRNTYAAWRRRTVAALLEGQQEPPARPEFFDPTGVKEIDLARTWIAQGRWHDALNTLDALADREDARARSLADVYRGVVHAEWGLGQEQAAEFYFRRAITGLQSASPADRLRTFNNYANFLLNRAQDRSNNHAFQMAAGVRSLFVTALTCWDESRQYYEAAEQLAQTASPNERALLDLNRARLYTILADLVATLDAPDPKARQLAEAEQALNRQAAQHVEKVLAGKLPIDPAVIAVAEAVDAHLAFRRGDFSECRKYASQSLAHYIEIGSLAGVENIERLLGAVALRTSEQAKSDESRGRTSRAALQHFMASHLLTEFLRNQVPTDRVGRTLAGFFSRRSYVNERIVELLIGEGKDVEALRFVELAKARALQDVMTARSAKSDFTAPTLYDNVLANWPPDVAALEYFLTAEHAWVFFVDRTGRAKAYRLVDAEGNALAARELVRRVQETLWSEMDQYATKLRERILEGRGFDHAWQDLLLQRRRELIPDAVLAQLGEAKTLLIVPHHILHYFPFAALVTARDDAARDSLSMVKPKFLVDATCNISYAPSLSTWRWGHDRSPAKLNRVSAVAIRESPGLPALPGVMQELDALRATFGTQVQSVLRDREAYKERVLQLLAEPGLVLVGTHGKNWPDQPLTSELRLYPHDRDDGRLTAAELYATDIKAELVVLSACYTALADKSPLPGDDLFGLQRALLQSGARTVVAGQWDIYDATGPELMKYFFESLQRGDSSSASVAAAQRKFLARLRASGEPEPWLHPYFWAVYALVGDERTSFQKH